MYALNKETVVKEYRQARDRVLDQKQQVMNYRHQIEARHELDNFILCLLDTYIRSLAEAEEKFNAQIHKYA